MNGLSRNASRVPDEGHGIFGHRMVYCGIRSRIRINAGEWCDPFPRPEGEFVKGLSRMIVVPACIALVANTPRALQRGYDRCRSMASGRSGKDEGQSHDSMLEEGILSSQQHPVSGSEEMYL